jgi:hypothetical protein
VSSAPALDPDDSIEPPVDDRGIAAGSSVHDVAGPVARDEHVCSRPSSRVTQTSALPDRQLSNATWWPSGDHAGSSFGALSNVSSREPVPSTFVTKICQSPSR